MCESKYQFQSVSSLESRTLFSRIRVTLRCLTIRWWKFEKENLVVIWKLDNYEIPYINSLFYLAINKI